MMMKHSDARTFANRTQTTKVENEREDLYVESD